MDWQKIINERLNFSKYENYKGYDILHKKFFIIQNFNRIEFDTFDEYYAYCEGNITENSCYFGYELESKIVNVENINYTSFIKDNIDNYPFEYKGKNVEELEKLKKWLNQNNKFRSYQDYKNKYGEFQKYLKKYNFLFFQECLNNHIKIEYLLRYLYEKKKNTKLLFKIVVLLYFNEYIEDFTKNYKKIFKDNKINEYNEIINEIKNGKVKIKKFSGGFDKENLIYFIEKTVLIKNKSYKVKKFFIEFYEFVDFLSYDLSNCDLYDAPLDSIDFSVFKVNNDTKLPIKWKCVADKGYNPYEEKFYYKRIYYNENNEVLCEMNHKFYFFCDYCFFLNYDLSESNFIFCDGIENIKNLPNIKFDNILVRSDVAQKFNLSINFLPKKYFDFCNAITLNLNDIDVEEYYISKFNFNNSSFNKLLNIDTKFEITNNLEKFKQDKTIKKINYVTDIHLIHRLIVNNCISQEDKLYILGNIIKQIIDSPNEITLIGGDIASEFEIFTEFITELKTSLNEKNKKIFITLGNHELWNFPNLSFEEIVLKYKSLLECKSIYLVQNNVFLIKYSGEVVEIPESVLTKMTLEELRNSTIDTYLVIFGGIGFAGKNDKFNAEKFYGSRGIYRDTISRKKEIFESEKIDFLYNKICNSLFDRNVIVFTHMPLYDWSSGDYKKNFIYVSGHTHYNYYYNDGKLKIYSDNQIGYHKKNVVLKEISFIYYKNNFSNYVDGIYNISKEEYISFCEHMYGTNSLSWPFKNLYMLKRNNIYMFILENANNKLYVLYKGYRCNLPNYSVDYFYNNMLEYYSIIEKRVINYFLYQEHISNEIKKIGGNGDIHGAIIDIDYYNHVFIGIDGSINPYYAINQTNKWFYDNIPSLLFDKLPKLYDAYNNVSNKSLDLIRIDDANLINKQNYYIEDKKIYSKNWYITLIKDLYETSVINSYKEDIFEFNESEEIDKLNYNCRVSYKENKNN